MWGAAAAEDIRTEAGVVEVIGSPQVKSWQGPLHLASLWSQMRVLCWRTWLQNLRNPTDVAVRIFDALFIGTVNGLVFLRTIDGASPCQTHPHSRQDPLRFFQI